MRTEELVTFRDLTRAALAGVVEATAAVLVLAVVFAVVCTIA